mmetsp:Transcript_6369/g.11421  ORF Transcript_6369/g.11421 Transcript_6369/m.11421 type:complete len:337 (+) Transcript_6369:325-1335(+)
MHDHRQDLLAPLHPDDLVVAHGLHQFDRGPPAAIGQQAQMFGPHAQYQRLAGLGAAGGQAQWQRAVQRHAIGAHRGGHEVDGRRAEEAGNKQVGRRLVDLGGRADLLDDAALHHDDARGQGHGLDLVVGHIDHGVAQGLVQQLEFTAQLGAQLGVEVGERLVEQEHAGLAHQRPADGDALALATRELRRLALQQRAQLQHVGGLLDAPGDLGLGHAGHARAEAHVLLDRHRRVERIALEHHADAALGGLGLSHVLAADMDAAAADVDQAGDAVQQRGLAAARRAEQHEEFALVDLQVQALDDFVRAELDAQALDVDATHFTAPAAMPRTNHRPEIR